MRRRAASLAATCPSLSKLRRSASLRGRDGKLNVDGDDAVRITIRKTAEKCAEELPLATGLAWADDFAIDDAVAARPIHPARI